MRTVHVRNEDFTNICISYVWTGCLQDLSLRSFGAINNYVND